MMHQNFHFIAAAIAFTITLVMQPSLVLSSEDSSIPTIPVSISISADTTGTSNPGALVVRMQVTNVSNSTITVPNGQHRSCALPVSIQATIIDEDGLLYEPVHCPGPVEPARSDFFSTLRTGGSLAFSFEITPEKGWYSRSAQKPLNFVRGLILRCRFQNGETGFLLKSEPMMFYQIPDVWLGKSEWAQVKLSSI